MRVQAVVGAVGLVLLVVAGSAWFMGPDDQSRPVSGLVAVGGAVLLLMAFVNRRRTSRSSPSGPSAATKARQALGAIGLVVAPITAAVGLLQVGTDPPAALPFAIATLVGLALWGQAIAAQARLPLRVAFAWLGLAIAFAVVVFPVAAGLGALVALVARTLGLGSDAAGALALGVPAAVVGAILAAWVANRPDRRAVPGAVRRAVFGHALPADIDTLASGPGPVLRREPPSFAETAARLARIAALDARLAGPASPAAASGDGPTDEATSPRIG